MKNKPLIIGLILLAASVITTVIIMIEKTNIKETDLFLIAVAAFIIGSLIGTGVAWEESR